MNEFQLEIRDGLLHDWWEKLREKPGEVVMVMRRPREKVLLMTKDFYPQGVYRLPTGGIHTGETPEDALVRETREETGLQAAIERKLGTIHWVLKNDGLPIEYYSHLFLIPETAGEPVAEDLGERITDFKEVDPCDLRQIGQDLMNLPGRWHDWGRFRGMVHQFVHDKLCG